MLLMKDFRLYRDRIEKTYRLFGKKKVQLNDAVVLLPNTYFRMIQVFPKGSVVRRLRNGIFFDSNVRGSNCQEDFKEACERVGITFDRKFGGLTGTKLDHHEKV